jgi:hypothetical protein
LNFKSLAVEMLLSALQPFQSTRKAKGPPVVFF